MKILKEDLKNKYSKAITAVEECMRKNDVKFTNVGTYTLVEIHDKQFRCDSTDFPRFTEEEKLIIIGNREK